MWSPSLGTRAVGIGDVSLTTSAARGVDRAGAARALSAALSAGLELVDIAPEEDSERLAGETIRELRLRDKAIAAPRVPALRTTPSGMTTRDTLVDRLPFKYVQSRVEAALRATRLDALPLAQLELQAAWRASPAWAELAGTCARLTREGKVLAGSAFTDHVADDTGELAKEAWLHGLAVPFSLCERSSIEALFTAAHAALEAPTDTEAATHDALRAAGLTPELAMMAGMPAELVLAAVPTGATTTPAPAPARTTPFAILARRPLAGGALAGTLGPGAKLKQRDGRNAIPAPTLDRITVAVARLAPFVKQTPPAARSIEASKSILDRMRRPDQLHAESLAELSLRYVLTKGALALPRLHRHEHVLDAMAASIQPPLPPDLVETLEHLDF